MQSAGGGGGGPGRVGPVGPDASTSTAAASLTSSSSAVSTPQLGFDSVQHQLQQQQQLASRQALQQQQQLLIKPEGNENLLSYQAGAFQGFMGGGNFPGSTQVPQQARKFLDLVQQHGSSQEGQNRGQGMEQQIPNPVHQAYIQFSLQAAQQKSALAMQSQQQAKMGVLAPSTSKDQDMRMGNLKLQEFTALQATNQGQVAPSTSKDQEMRMGNLKLQEFMALQVTNQGQVSSSNNASEHFSCGEKQLEKGRQPASEQRHEQKPVTQPAGIGQFMPANIIRPMQAPQAQQSIQNTENNQFAAAAKLHAMQVWALERNIDLSQPQNANLMAQLLPLMQSRMAVQQKANEPNTGGQAPSIPASKQQLASPTVASESSLHANSSCDVSGHSGSANARQALPVDPFTLNAGIGNCSNNLTMQQVAFHNRENQVPSRQSAMLGNGMPLMLPPQSLSNVIQDSDQGLPVKNALNSSDTLQIQHLRQFNRSSPQSGGPSNDSCLSNQFPSQDGLPVQTSNQLIGFTKHQLHVLKAQILAFRRLKKGEVTLPQEILQSIVPPPLELQHQQQLPSGAGCNQDISAGKNAEDQTRHMETIEDSHAVPSTNGLNASKLEAVVGDEKANVSISQMQGSSAAMKEPMSMLVAENEEQQAAVFPIKSDQDNEHGLQKTPLRSGLTEDRGKAVSTQPTMSDAMQAKKPAQASTAPQPKDVGSGRKYHGPLFDFPSFTRKHDSVGSIGTINTNTNLTLAYDVKDLLFEEGLEVLSKKMSGNLKKINGLLAVNLERKRIRPDLVLWLQIEEKKLRLLDLQVHLRDAINQQQQEIMAMPDRPYRKFVCLCDRQRMELARQMQASQKALRDKQLKSIFQWRKKLLEAHWGIHDAQTARNSGVAKYHEKMLRGFSKRKDDDRNKRMEALKNNEVERYREMLLEKQTSIPGDASERYAVLSSFLTQTEEYLHKLGSKITAAKNQQEVEEAANAAAQLQGLSEEEVRAAAACAGKEVMIRNRFMEMNACKDSSSVSKYYTLAHAVNERVIRQPSMLQAGTLRDYQLVGLQWMLSLYNNKLNGILADEMGLGKTVQVMALIAYLMEFKGNYGPHLIIVPNAVLVNWRSEFHNWLPSFSCIFYVGGKDQRSKLFSQEVSAMKFNVLVTTYEFIMYDRSKLSKVDWKYIVIDEAQRMKDRESVVARDLDRYHCQRRLLLTGTPLQNDLKELWSLLNLLLPEVFDNRKAFHDWFSKPFQKEDPTHDAKDDWLETEKKVIIIHRLHQILEPFMLRRRVEDVEGSLPPKVSIVLRCKMSAIQSAIYDWIKSTGTIRVDPEDEKRRVQKNPIYQAKVYKPLNNRCMELRKVCNHPLLNYPYFSDFSKDFLVRSCGKLWILDRILIKLQRTGHQVLLFSTMTKLLDILEDYLLWRQLVYRRIDGTTSLEDRESAIVDFNSPDTDCFIFLLSIHAAGRGLNLQSADTVIIYDPDPNPKNEEQAVARAHRIGQTREVKVIYMEAVVDKISSHQKEDEIRSRHTLDLEDDLAGKDRYMGSIESLIRNNIQQYKIDMADEVINAGRFDQRTTHEERRMTLETLLHDEERYQETLHDVPSLQEVNRMIARSKDEVELFDQMDGELEYAEEMTRYNQVPKWLRASTKEVNATVANLSKKPSKNILFAGGMGSGKVERERGRRKGKKSPNYKEVDDENGEYSEASSDEQNGYSAHEEEGEISAFEDDESSGAVGAQPTNKDQTDDDIPVCDGGYEYSRSTESARNSCIQEEASSSGSSSDSQRMTRTVSPVSSQKFGSLSALDGRPGSYSKRLTDELEEGEIAVSGDSQLDHQQSGSWIHDRDEGEDEQVLKPKIKQKRSLRIRPRHAMEKLEKSGNEVKCGDSSLLPFQVDNKYQAQLRVGGETKPFGELSVAKHDKSYSTKRRQNFPPRRVANTSKLHASPKYSRLNLQSPLEEDASEHPRDSWDGKVSKMPDAIQRTCKNVISIFQRKIDKEGQHIIPLLTDLWKRIGNSSYTSGAGNKMLDLRKIGLRLDGLEYDGVMELVFDVQFMLKSTMQFYGFSHEARSEARKVHDLFFDILNSAFPDTDFLEARNALSFSDPASTSTPPPRKVAFGRNKRHKLINEVEPESGTTHKTTHQGSTSPGEVTTARVHMPQKATRLGCGSDSSQEHEQDDSPHPGELVICKKKRKDRDKSVLKSRTGSGGPVSPPSMGCNIISPVSGSVPKDGRLSGQSSRHKRWSNQSQPTKSGGRAGWANPVKRLRTDASKRRASHL